LSIGRQNLYDGLWKQFQHVLDFRALYGISWWWGSCTLSLLNDHLVELKHMMQNYGAGVHACYRVKAFYDASKNKVVVTNVIKWSNSYRDILK